VNSTRYTNRIKRPAADSSPRQEPIVETARALCRASLPPLTHRDRCHQKMVAAGQYGTKFGRIQSLPAVAAPAPFPEKRS
jgi:hypothetical protein